MESVVRILLMWMLVTVVAAGPTKPPTRTVIPSPKDNTFPVPTQPIPSATPQGRPILSTTPGLSQVATTKTIDTKVETKTIASDERASVIQSLSTTEKSASEKVLSPVKSVNGHPASNGKVVLPPVENANKNILEAKENSDKIGEIVRETESIRTSPVQKIQKGRVSIDETKTDSVASPSMQRVSNVIIAPPMFVHLPPELTREQTVGKKASGVHERNHKNIANTERVWADFSNLSTNNTNVINKQIRKESEPIIQDNTFKPIRLVGKKVVPKYSDRSFTIQSRSDHLVLPFPIQFPSFTKSIEPAFQPSRQFDQQFPDQNSFVPSRPPALAAPFIQLKKDDIPKTMTSKNTEAKEILPKHFNRTIGNENSFATNSKASTNQTETVMKSKKEMSELSETTVTSPSRKIVESIKLSSNTKDSRAPSKIRQLPTQASINSKIKASESNKELLKIEESRNNIHVEINSDKPGSRNATKTENPALSDKLNQSTNTTSRLASTIHSSQSKLPSRTSEISWSNIITHRPAHSSDKINIVKEIVAQEEKEEQSKAPTKTDPTKAIMVKKYVPSASLMNNVIIQGQKPVASQLKPVQIQPSGGSDNVNNTFEIDRLNFKLPTAIRNHRKETPEHVEGDSMVAASQVSLTGLALEMARPVRTHRIRGGSPKIQQVLSDMDVNTHQVVTVTNAELDELMRSAPPSVKLRNFETLDSTEKKLVMQNLQKKENNDFRGVSRQPELYEGDASSSLIRQLTTQRRPSVNSQASRKSRPTKHTEDLQDSEVFDVKTSDYIKISGEKEFLKFAQSDKFFGNLKDHPNKPKRPLHLQADQMFSNPDMRVTKLSPVQVMRNVGNDNNFDGLGAMLDEGQNSREDNVFYDELASVRENSGKDKWNEVRHHDRHPAILTIRNTQSQEQRHTVAKPQLVRSTQSQDQRPPVPTTQVQRDTQSQGQRPPVPKSPLAQSTQPKDQRHTVPTSQLLRSTQPQDQRHTVPTSQLVQNSEPKDQRHTVPTSQLVQNSEPKDQRHTAPTSQLLRSTQPQDQRHTVPISQLVQNSEPKDQRHTVPTSQLVQNSEPKDQRHTVPTSQLLRNTQPQDQRHTVPTSQLVQNSEPKDQRHTVPTSQLVQNSEPKDQRHTVPTLQLVRNAQTGPLPHSVSGSQLLLQQQKQQELQKLQLEKQEQQLRTQLQQELREQGKLLQKIEIQEENQRRAHQLQQQIDKQKEEHLQKQHQQEVQLQLHQQEQQGLQLQPERQKKEQLQNQRQKHHGQLQPQEEQILQQQIGKQIEERFHKQGQQPIPIQQQEQQKQQQQLQKEKEEHHQKQFQLQQQVQQKLLQQQQAQEAIERQKREEIQKQKQLQQSVFLQSKDQGQNQLAVEGRQATSENWLQFQRQPNLPVPNLEGQRPPTLQQLPPFVKGEPSFIQLHQFPRNLPMPEPVLLNFLDQIPDNIDELQVIDGNGVELQMSASVPRLAEALLRNNREAVYPEHDPRFFPVAGYNIMPYFLGFPSFGYFDMDVHKE